MPTNKKCISIGIKTAYSPTCTTVPLSIRTLPVARGHWALYSDAADAGKAQHTHRHTHTEDDYKEICVSA